MNERDQQLADDIKHQISRLNILFENAAQRKLKVDLAVLELGAIDEGKPIVLLVEVWTKL